MKTSRSSLDELVEGILSVSHVDEYPKKPSSSPSASPKVEHAQHEAEVRSLTLLQQNIDALAKAMDEYTASDHVKFARDRKLKLVMEVLYQNLSSNAGKRFLRCEASTPRLSTYMYLCSYILQQN